MHIYMQVFNKYRRQEIKDKGSMQARWRINAPAVMYIYIYIYDVGDGDGDENQNALLLIGKWT